MGEVKKSLFDKTGFSRRRLSCYEGSFDRQWRPRHDKVVARNESRLDRKRLSVCVEDDGGFTQIGVVIAMLLVVSLLFVSAQGYWMQSNAADIQVAADAGALAGTNVVGEYMVVARVADALVLSLSLLGLSLYALSALAACLPYVDTLAGTLSQAAQRVLDARDTFADEAIRMLDNLQRALPFLCAVNASTSIRANGAASPLKANYIGIALPVPLEGQATEIVSDEESEQAGTVIEENNPEVSTFLEEAREAEEEMKAAKLAGYQADCGVSSTSFSQYERALKLAGLAGVSNPRYSSVDVWDFEVAIQRAQTYYQARIANEKPARDTIKEITQSIARKKFYCFALEEVSKGSVSTDASGVTTVYMPFLPENTAEMKMTYLYTEKVYPISSSTGDRVLHSSTSCPACGRVIGLGALCDIDLKTVHDCVVCRFSIDTIGKVPAASTVIENGFEYHYKAVATAAARYSKASKIYVEKSALAKKGTQESLDSFTEALKSFKARRYHPLPPGRYGCVALVFDLETHEPPASLGNFVDTVITIGPRMAISAAMLAPDDPVQGANVISSLLGGIVAENASAENASTGDGFVEATVSLWGDLLLSYLEGTEGLVDGSKEFLNVMPELADGGLSSWAETSYLDILELIGLEPTEMESLKPVLVNSSRVLAHSDTGLADFLSGARGAYEVLNADCISLSLTVTEGLPPCEIKIALPKSAASASDDLFALFSSSMNDARDIQVPIGDAWE